MAVLKVSWCGITPPPSSPAGIETAIGSAT
jgi:hypothetical protein